MLKIAQYAFIGLFCGVAAASFIVGMLSFGIFLMDTFGTGIGGWIMLSCIFGVVGVGIAVSAIEDFKK